MDMSLVGMASDLAQTKIASAVGTAVLSKAMDVQEVQGKGILKMIDAAAMERSVYPAIGSNFDMSV